MSHFINFSVSQIKTASRTILLFAILLSNFAAHADQTDAIVGLYATLQDGRKDLGTGFLSSDQGQIVTAYHVVHGAKGITAITSDGMTYPDVVVSYVAPNRDLAVLQILGFRGSAEPLLLTDRVPGPNEELIIIGYPRGLPRQQIRARSTTDELISSFALRNTRGERLFDHDLEIVPLDATIYSGMSGAPIIGSDGVLGVLSGSFDEGGTIAWMIPIKHTSHLYSTNNASPSAMTWPHFDLMANGFRGLSRRFEVDSVGEQLLQAYIRSVEQYASAAHNVLAAAELVRVSSMATKGLLLSARANPSHFRTLDDAFYYLELAISEDDVARTGSLLEAVASYGTATAELTQSWRQVENWSMDAETADQQIKSNIYSIGQNFNSLGFELLGNAIQEYYGHQNASTEEIFQTILALNTRVFESMNEMETNYTPARFSQALDDLLAHIGFMESFSSGLSSERSSSLLRRQTSQLRAVPANFEQLVYQE